MSSSRALGIGLIAGGLVLGGLVLLNLLVNLAGGQLQAGGAVLGLLLVAVLALPLVGGGLFVLSRGREEERAALQFETQRRTFDSDRLFRAQQARELGQLARRVEGSGAAGSAELAQRLRDLVEDLERPGYDQAAWYEAVELGRADLEALRRYDDLLSSGVHQLEDLVGRLEAGQAVGPELGRTIRDWELNLRGRTDLLRGRRAPAVTPGALLRARPALTGSTDLLVDLKPGDAISRMGEDFLVETSAEYFAGGRTWRLHRLLAEQQEAWLYVGPGGLEVAWLAAGPPAISPGPPQIQVDGAACELVESVSAAAVVRTRQGAESSGAATVYRYSCDDGRLILAERWPDRNLVYSGQPIPPSDLDVWPSEPRSPLEA